MGRERAVRTVGGGKDPISQLSGERLDRAMQWWKTV